MTRREEITNNIGYKITKAAMEYYQTNCANDVDLSEAFEGGAEWMQNTMIEKACKWLFENVYDYLIPEDQERVESFRKYLEE